MRSTGGEAGLRSHGQQMTGVRSQERRGATLARVVRVPAGASPKQRRGRRSPVKRERERPVAAISPGFLRQRWKWLVVDQIQDANEAHACSFAAPRRSNRAGFHA